MGSGNDAASGAKPMTDMIPSERERQLELDVARLEAQVADLRGSGAVESASRLLAMAASTIDVAMAEAKQESSKARAEAAELTSAALAEVVEIKARAESEAMALVDTERRRVADEIDALQEVRTALESERHDLENYHSELRRRVQELAESMVAFMSTEPPIAALSVIDGLNTPEIDETTEAAPSEFSGVPVVEVDQGPSMFRQAGKWLDAPLAEAPAEQLSTPHSVDDLVEDMAEERRFEAFIDGDENDKSRSWLLHQEVD